MNSQEIKELIEQLDWNNPNIMQDEAIEKLSIIDEQNMQFLLQPIDKKYWYNAARAIIKIGYPRINSIIPGLLIWLKDINWPGAEIILTFLVEINKEKLISFIENALIEAKKDEDYMWIGSIKRLVNKSKISCTDFKQKDVYEILSLADW
jgi:hypothetical protein